MAKMKRKFNLGTGASKEVLVEVDGSTMTGKLHDMVVYYGGNRIATASTDREIRSGTTASIPEGQLSARVVRKAFAGDQIELLLNGEAVGESAGDPKGVVDTAVAALFFIGGLSVLLGLVAELGQVSDLLEAGAGWVNVVGGAIYIALGFAVRTYSWVGFIALLIANIAFVGDTIITIGLFAAGGAAMGGGAIGLRVAVFILLIRAVGSAWTLARTRQRGKMPIRQRIA